MKVFFDSKISSIQPYGGISRMVFELLNSLNKKKDVEKIFYRGLYVDQYPYQKEWFARYYRIKSPVFLKGRLMRFLDDIGSKVVYGLNQDTEIIHSFYHRIPKNPKGKLVVHAYDMIQELFYHMPKAAAFKKKSFEKADAIVAISQSTKNDVCRLYSINPEKVTVAHLAADEIFFRENIQLTKPARPYMLYVGGRGYEYKNFNFLLDTFIEKKYFLDFDLVLFGGEKELTAAQKEKIKHTTGQGDWLVQKFGNDEILAKIYKNAFLFIYPSRYEGFGIPTLEAMASGCPVVALASSSIPEVVGDAGLLFNPEDTDDLARNIEKIMQDKNLAADLVKKGRARARQFSWDAMADTMYQLYVTLK